MTYTLGIDLGTTFTSAAVARHGRAEVVALGHRATSVPSVVVLTEDGRLLVGEAAERRAATAPDRVAREFKRRVGDVTPLLLGGTPVAVDACLAAVLRWVHDTVAQNEGGPPAAITVTHPANWGEFKKDVLREALRLADLRVPDIGLLPEPVAAAQWYAQTERLAPGSIVAVYDLGGGTFDAAVLQRTPDGGFAPLGRPEGIERLGGIDVDEAVLGHVLRTLGEDVLARTGVLAVLQGGVADPAAATAMAQLRKACVEAKEALSAETSITIPVWLPGLHHEVLLRRAELEELVSPMLQPSVTALARVVVSAGLDPHRIDAVLLVGGASRMPLIARQVSAGLERPVVVDAHPKHPVALGAALDAAARVTRVAPVSPTLPTSPAAAFPTPTAHPASPSRTASPFPPPAEVPAPAPAADVPTSVAAATPSPPPSPPSPPSFDGGTAAPPRPVEPAWEPDGPFPPSGGGSGDHVVPPAARRIGATAPYQSHRPSLWDAVTPRTVGSAAIVVLALVAAAAAVWLNRGAPDEDDGGGTIAGAEAEVPDPGDDAGDAGDAGAVPGVSPARFAWQYERGEETSGDTVGIDEERVYFADSQGYLVALDAASGNEVWTVDVGADASGCRPTRVGDLLLIGIGSPSATYALDPATGQQVWKAPGVWLDPPVAAGDLLIGHAGSTVTALDLATGQVRWQVTDTYWSLTTPVVVGEVIVIGSNDGHVAGLDRATGAQLWTTPLDRGDVDIRRFGATADAAVVIDEDGFVTVVDVATGRKRWTKDLEADGHDRPLLLGDDLLIGVEGGIAVVDPATGDVRDTLDVAAAGFVPLPGETPGIVVFDALSLQAFDVAGRSLWVTDVPIDGLILTAGPSSVAVHDYDGTLAYFTFD
ncbi:MAG TPA: Hsp70 family protein [Acidimicrobiales bacterium]